MRIPLPVVIAAIVVIVAAVPLILRKIPRNHFYGIRTERAMSGDSAQWYAVNQIGGWALAIAGAITLLSCFLVPRFLNDAHTAGLVCTGVLVCSTLLSLLVASSIKVGSSIR